MRAHAAPSGESFIERYTEWADVTEAPRLMHTVVAVQLVASLLNRNGVTFKLGSITSPLDLWVLLLSGSGGGRNVTVGRARDLVKQAGFELIRSDWGSPQACYQDLAENPWGLWVWGEMGAKMEALKSKEFRGLLKWLTDRYDESHLPEDVKYRDTGKRSNTPPIEFKSAPRMNFLATSSEAWFFQHLAATDSTGGFIPRWLLMRADEPTKHVPIPPELDKQLGERLAQDLKRLEGLKGEADLTAVTDLYEEWYGATAKRFASQPNADLATAFWHRHRMHIPKLAVVYEAASSFSLKVTEASWKQAVSTGQALETVIFKMLGTGMTKQGHELEEVEQWFREGRAKGRTKTEYTLKYKNLEPKVRDARLQTLQDSGTIHRLHDRKTGGRPAEEFVHGDFYRPDGEAG
jgi:hypothetical protein